jgi:hypothetical protein
LVLAVAVSALSVGAVLWSCSGNNDAPPSIGGNPDPDPSSSAPVDCSVPNAGCACTDPGETVKCGHVVYKSEDYVSCSVGLRTCQTDGTWSDCKGTQVVTLNSHPSQGLHLLTQPTAVAANNTCDPNLFEVNAILGTQDASIDDGGVTVSESGTVSLTYLGSGGTVGCGDATPPPLTISPADASLVITTIATPPSPNTLQFTAYSSGCVGDGAVAAIWTIDQPSVSTITADGGAFTLAYPYAGTINVTAYVGSLSGTAPISVTVNQTDTSGVTDGGGLKTAFSTTCGLDAGGG